MTNCGPGGSGTESCCTSLEVDGGTFYRKYSYSVSSGPSGEAGQATVSGFRLDKYTVTVGRFRQFVNAWNNGSGWVPPPGSGKHTHLNGGRGLVTGSGDAGDVYEPGWATADNVHVSPTDANLATYCSLMPNYKYWTSSVGSEENLPMNCLNWWDAYAFCIWDGGFLPSDAEWECAAAGGSEQREYPWGSTDPGTNNQYAIYNCNYPNGSGACTGVTNIAPVGTASMGEGKWHQLDLVGNMAQWTLDGTYALGATFQEPCVDCMHLATDKYRESRGLDFEFALSFLSVPTAGNGADASFREEVGVRCARTP
jgi:formylglycine-generating enzyme required for sulfatase activity